MITTKDLSDIIKAHGWAVTHELSIHWLNNDVVIVTQQTNYGFSGFKMIFRNDELIDFEALEPLEEE